MATDLARISFDPARRYRGVVAQQGRVSLEAEENEERDIFAVERLEELLDIVGPAGTPDDGYAVTGGPGFDLTIGAGTMYVGGIRVSLAAPIHYRAQPDWIDHVGDPDWVPVPARSHTGNEHVVLVLREQDVTAFEDPMLFETALGGPDGAARLRILQRIERFATTATDCPDALAADEVRWAAEGLVFDPADMRLQSQTRLLVSWQGPPPPPDPCEPNFSGGYLGADNQLIRVQIAGVNPKSGEVSLLWGWDNASFLYRVTATDGSAVVTFDRSPVDDFHQPQTGQAVEVLRSAAQLASTDGVVEGYAASATGLATVLAAPYDPDTKTVQLGVPLGAPYTSAAETPQLYLRVWQGLLTGHKVGDVVVLPGTGVQVQLSTVGGAPVHVGDYWSIGLRPLTPNAVYPARLLRQPQPPNGPRLWACPLAVIAWSKRTMALLEDCRNHFPPLTGVDVQDSGCCQVSVKPSDGQGVRLQALIDKACVARPEHDRAHRVTVCLQPGLYQLERPLHLDARHSNLTLEACGSGAVLRAAPGAASSAFAQGLVVLVRANNVTISGIEFELPQVPMGSAAVKGLLPDEIDVVTSNRWSSIGVRPVHCAQLEVSDCLFRFSLGPANTTPEVAQTMPRNVFGVGIYAGSECWGLNLSRNRFLHGEPDAIGLSGRELHLLVGFLLGPTAAFRPAKSSGETKRVEAMLVRSLLQDAVIRDNRFDGITVGAVVFADIGSIRIEDNVVRRCYGGIWLLSIQAQSYVDVVGTYQIDNNVRSAAASLRSSVLSATFDPAMLLASVLGRTYPLPTGFDPGVGAETKAAVEASVVARKQQLWMREFVDNALIFFREASADGASAADASPPVSGASSSAQTTNFNAGTATKEAFVGSIAPNAAELTNAQFALSAFEREAAVDISHGRGLELTCTDNVVECAVGSTGSTGAALLVWDAERRSSGTVVIANNRLTGRTQSGAVVSVLAVSQATVTGNLILNSSEKPGSLALFPTSDGVAITGNVFEGPPRLPQRPNAAPFDSWLPFNAEI